jgi:3-isopropylmalate dehydrogenase
MGQYNIVVLPGDGVGPEIIQEGMKVIRRALERVPLDIQFTELEMGVGRFRRDGIAIAPADLERIKKADAIYFGAVGLPGIQVPFDQSPMGLLRRTLDLFANVRPIKLYSGVESPLKKAETTGIDYVIYRENTEGLYTFGKGGFFIGDEAAVNPMIISRKGTERIVRAAFEMARQRKGSPADGVKRVTCVDKANVVEAYQFFRKIFYEVAGKYPDVQREHFHADAMTVHMLQRPDRFDVIVTENMFGDILSDLGSGTVGGLGLAPSMEIGEKHGLFQPIHGSAPDIAGKGIVNPIATILAAAMMFNWLGRKNNDEKALEVAQKIEKATEKVLAARKIRTPDMGGKNGTADMGNAVIREL